MVLDLDIVSVVEIIDFTMLTVQVKVFAGTIIAVLPRSRRSLRPLPLPPPFGFGYIVTVVTIVLVDLNRVYLA